MKIIAGVEKSYNGEVVFSPGYTVGYLEQEPKLDDSKTVKELVQEGVQEVMDVLNEYEAINKSFELPEVYEDADKMDKLMNRQAEFRRKSTCSMHGISTISWSGQWMHFAVPTG
jgi:energy-dependent translational throttle protein EttA